jgi:hypothetical protein
MDDFFLRIQRGDVAIFAVGVHHAYTDRVCERKGIRAAEFASIKAMLANGCRCAFESLTKNNDECHLDCFYFGSGDEASGAGSSAVCLFFGRVPVCKKIHAGSVN